MGRSARTAGGTLEGALALSYQAAARVTQTCTMFAHSLRALIATATLALSCSAWQAPAVAHHMRASRSQAFAGAGALLCGGGGVRLRPATCSVNMVATGSSNDAAAGAVQSYMSKIPPHLQGLAIRNQAKIDRDYGKKGAALKGEDQDLLAIQAELDEEEEDYEDEVDYAMQVIDELGDEPKMRTYDLDIKDAEILRSLKDNMHKEDFRAVFGRGVGELL